MTDEGDINQMVFEATAAKIKDFCERRLGQGATDEELNIELKDFVPLVSAWARRQRMLVKLMLDNSTSSTLQ